MSNPTAIAERMRRLAAALDQVPTSSGGLLIGAAAIEAHRAAVDAGLSDHLDGCGVPPAISRLVVGGLRESGFSAVGVVRAWMRRADAPMLLMSGGVGSGKSCAAAESMKLARKPATIVDDEGTLLPSEQWDTSRGLFVSAARLSSCASWTDEGARLWGRARSAVVLVVDDLGVESVTERGPFLSDLHDLVDSRYQDPTHRTVITTNLEGKAFVERYGARILSRVRERGVACSVGKLDLRGKVA